MSSSSKDNTQRTPKKQVDPIFKDPTNIFMVQNPQILPPMTEASRKRLRQALHSISIVGFRNKAKIWLDNMGENQVAQMLVRIKQVNNKDSNTLHKYSLLFYPKYLTFTLDSSQLSNNTFNLEGIFSNITKDPFKNFSVFANWNFKHKQFDCGSKLSFYSPWEISVKKKWGKPLDTKWVTDCRLFTLTRYFKSDQRVLGKFKPFEFNNQSVFLQMKGYDTRLKRGIIQEPAIYLNNQTLKKIDLIEGGYHLQKYINNASSYFSFKVSAGSDFYNMYYGRIIAKYLTNIVLSNRLGLTSSSQIGLIDGKNVIPHEMFSRNENKWMGERSKIYAHQRFDLTARGIALLESLKIVPSNYLSLWLSRSFENKIKAQAELGISFGIIHTACRFGISLFRIAGVKGEPKFGLKYEF